MKQLTILAVLLCFLASCNIDNNYVRCTEKGYCSGHTKSVNDNTLEYCNLPHCNPYHENCAFHYPKNK